ncbi:hypothetical protein [Nocardioides panacisoli]|uniref:DUF3558 domain-containing protein n=1 Tax=Nocardioides panacisoli TaxID=627624 RepID=A0ABP7HVQ1_9ACTN
MRAQILGLGVVLLAVQACSEGPRASGSDASPDGSADTGLDCGSLITTEAVDALGWPVAEPEEHAGRCQLITSRGQVTVGTRAVPASSERADAVQQELETQCDRLRADGPHFVGRPDWLADDTDGCLAQVDPQTRTGVAELLFLNRRDEVVQIRIASAHPVAVGRVGEAFRRLAGSALDLCDASCA